MQLEPDRRDQQDRPDVSGGAGQQRPEGHQRARPDERVVLAGSTSAARRRGLLDHHRGGGSGVSAAPASLSGAAWSQAWCHGTAPSRPAGCRVAPRAGRRAAARPARCGRTAGRSWRLDRPARRAASHRAASRSSASARSDPAGDPAGRPEQEQPTGDPHHHPGHGVVVRGPDRERGDRPEPGPGRRGELDVDGVLAVRARLGRDVDRGPCARRAPRPAWRPGIRSRAGVREASVSWTLTGSARSLTTVSGNRPVRLESVMLPPSRMRTCSSSASTALTALGHERCGALRLGPPGRGDQPQSGRVRCAPVEPARLERSPATTGSVERGVQLGARLLLQRATPARYARGQLGGRGAVGVARARPSADRAGTDGVQRHLLHPRHVLVERVEHRGRRDRRRLVAGDDEDGLPDDRCPSGRRARPARCGRAAAGGRRPRSPRGLVRRSALESATNRSCSALSASTAVSDPSPPISSRAVGAELVGRRRRRRRAAAWSRRPRRVARPSAWSSQPPGGRNSVARLVRPVEPERRRRRAAAASSAVTSTSATRPDRPSATRSTSAYGVSVTRPASARRRTCSSQSAARVAAGTWLAPTPGRAGRSARRSRRPDRPPPRPPPGRPAR